MTDPASPGRDWAALVERVLEPLRSEDAAFRVLLAVVAIAVLVIAVALLIRAVA